MATTIFINYDNIKKMSNLAEERRSQSKTMEKRLQQQATILRGGAWQSQAATEFQKDFANTLEGIQRLAHALDVMTTTLAQIARLFREAEIQGRDGIAGIQQDGGFQFPSLSQIYAAALTNAVFGPVLGPIIDRTFGVSAASANQNFGEFKLPDKLANIWGLAGNAGVGQVVGPILRRLGIWDALGPTGQQIVEGIVGESAENSLDKLMGNVDRVMKGEIPITQVFDGMDVNSFVDDIAGGGVSTLLDLTRVGKIASIVNDINQVGGSLYHDATLVYRNWLTGGNDQSIAYNTITNSAQTLSNVIDRSDLGNITKGLGRVINDVYIQPVTDQIGATIQNPSLENMQTLAQRIATRAIPIPGVNTVALINEQISDSARGRETLGNIVQLAGDTVDFSAAVTSLPSAYVEHGLNVITATGQNWVERSGLPMETQTALQNTLERTVSTNRIVADLATGNWNSVLNPTPGNPGDIARGQQGTGDWLKGIFGLN